MGERSPLTVNKKSKSVTSSYCFYYSRIRIKKREVSEDFQFAKIFNALFNAFMNRIIFKRVI